MPDSSPHLDEHTSAAPAISPGPVGNDERLLRELFDPQHIENGQVVETAIDLHDLRARGFSVHRMSHTSATVVKDSIKERLSRPRSDGPWKDEGVAFLKAKEVRQISEEGEQMFVVIDTARTDHIAHASIYVAAPKKGKAYARKARRMLLPLLKKRMSVDEAFQRGHEDGT